MKARAWFELSPDGKGTTNGELYGEFYPELPGEFAYLPDFLEEAGTVGTGINGLTRLSYSELESWSRLMKMPLSLFEVRCLRAMSAAYCAIANNPKSECPIDSDVIRERIDDANAATWDRI